MIFNLQNGENGDKLKAQLKKMAFSARIRDSFFVDAPVGQD